MIVVFGGGAGGVARVQQVAGAEPSQRVRLPTCGRHEHFERTGGIEVVEGREVPVFRWSYTTAIAE
ncbi:DUF5988 family protein [Streptomyces sp. NBC_00237]|uniref:DUF5988 family protein n=1 Tax=Streptomyces sp. NBC_00237 TaxID=2975687 RepID=UPI002258478E|nr:DUF5988 family protein [Streptomyces sp. NBC_00237]MCX5205773.1 DUF5988 family protein [Streptomyces sp. NBC_00237]